MTIKNEGDRLEEENRKLLDELIETKENIKNEQSELNQMIGEAKEDLSKTSEKMRAEMLRLEGLIRQGNQLNQVAAESREGKITQIDPISESGEDRAQAYSLEAFVNMRNRRYEEALTAIEKAIELDPDNAKFMETKGALEFRLEKYPEALSIINEVLKKDPTTAYAYRCRAMIYAEMRKNHLFDCDDNMIEEDFSKSLSLDENSAYTSNELARFYLSIGEKDKALEQIKRAHDFDPLEPEVYHTYELYYQAIGDEEQEKYYHMLAEKHGYIPDL